MWALNILQWKNDVHSLEPRLQPAQAVPINAGSFHVQATKTCCTFALYDFDLAVQRTFGHPVSVADNSENMLAKKLIVAAALLLAMVFLAEARDDGPHDMADALRMLQELDRYYTQAARPRFGKRSDAFANWVKDLEKPDLPTWLTYARRR
ncbi:unnamed protein product, partial [Iphiclides podalirius]